MLLDSNIIIYAAQPEYIALRRFIEIQAPAISVISYIEVLGYQGNRMLRTMQAFLVKISAHEPPTDSGMKYESKGL